MTTVAAPIADSPDVEEKDIKDTMSEKAIKQLLAQGKLRGYITYEELNEVIPEDKLNSEQIEDIMSMISDMGISVIEDEEAEQGEKPKPVRLGEEAGEEE